MEAVSKLDSDMTCNRRLHLYSHGRYHNSIAYAVAHQSADGHSACIGAVNGDVFDIYVFDFTNADAEQPGADDELIVFIGEIAHRMALQSTPVMSKSAVSTKYAPIAPI